MKMWRMNAENFYKTFRNIRKNESICFSFNFIAKYVLCFHTFTEFQSKVSRKVNLLLNFQNNVFYIFVPEKTK